jgi:hypothetical protein
MYGRLLIMAVNSLMTSEISLLQPTAYIEQKPNPLYRLCLVGSTFGTEMTITFVTNHQSKMSL